MFVRCGQIVLLMMFAAVCYGILHDQVTARVSVEYFTIAHPPVFGTDDPTLLGLGWGIISTWWVGLIMGIPLALVAQAGKRPSLSVTQFVRPTLILLGVMGVCATMAGLLGWEAAQAKMAVLLPPLSYAVPADRQVPLIAVASAHNASYLSGFIGGLVLMVWAWRRRDHLARNQTAQATAESAAS